MFKMQVPAFADTQNLKLFFTPHKIQMLKKTFRKFVGYSVIVSIFGVDLAYAMEDGDLGHGASRYVAPALILPKDKDTTELSAPFMEGQGSPPSSDSLSFSDDQEESPRKSSSGESGSPDGSRPPSPSNKGLADQDHEEEVEGNSSGEEIEPLNKLPGGMAFTLSPKNGNASFEKVENGEDESGEGPALLQGLPAGTDIELADMSFTLLPKDGDAPQSLFEMREQMLRNFDTEEGSVFAEGKKNLRERLEVRLKNQTEKIKEGLSKKCKRYSIVGENAEYLLPEQQDELIQKAHALHAQIKGTSLEEFGKYFKKRIIDNTWSWRQWASLVPAAGMAAGTAPALAIIVVGTLYSKYYTPDLNNNTELTATTDLVRYVLASTSLLALIDSSSFMTKATSPSTRKFTAKKSWWERTADWVLIPLGSPQVLFLELLFFQFTQQNKEAAGITGWWNYPDRYFYLSSLGFVPYLLLIKAWGGIRGAIHRNFHRDVPSHVQDRVTALHQLKERVEHDFTDGEVTELYNFLKNPSFVQHASKLKEWMNYCFRGEVSKDVTVEGLLTYMCLTKYAQAEMTKEPEEQQMCKCNVKANLSRFAAGVALPAAVSIIFASFLDLFTVFTGEEGALTVASTLAILGLVSGWFLQSHGYESTLEAFWEGFGPYFRRKANIIHTLKDPYAWASGAGKTVSYTFGFAQNALTNLLPILILLGVILPERLAQIIGGDGETQQEKEDSQQKKEDIIAGIMVGVATPFILNEMVIGTNDIGEHMMAVPRFARSVYHKTSDFVITSCCKRPAPKSSHRKRRWLQQKLQETIAVTLQFSREHVEKLETLEQLLVNGGSAEEF